MAVLSVGVTDPAPKHSRGEIAATVESGAARGTSSDWCPAGLSQQLLQRLEGVGFADGLVPANAVDAREAHRHPRFVAGPGGDAVERGPGDDLRRHLAHRPVTLHGVVADPAVEALQFLVGEARIGLADGHQLRTAPGAK